LGGTAAEVLDEEFTHGCFYYRWRD
jgi:hypothetical protein